MRPNGLVFARMLALAATIAAGFSACSPALDWRDFTWPDGGFSVLLPARPTPETREISVGPLRLDMHLFSASVAGDVYAAGYAELPAGMDGAARERLLGDAQTAFARNVGGTAEALQHNAVAGFPCRQFSVAGTSGRRAVRLTARVCVTDRRFYQLVHIGPPEHAATADVPLFLGSFKLVR